MVKRFDTDRLIPQVKATYDTLLSRLQGKLRSGKLTEEQRIRIFFFVKGQEISTMTQKDLHRTLQKYEALKDASVRTISSLEVRAKHPFRGLPFPKGKTAVTFRKRLEASWRKKYADRLRLEKVFLAECRKLIGKIQKRLVKST